jgi:hypothetical protein
MAIGPVSYRGVARLYPYPREGDSVAPPNGWKLYPCRVSQDEIDMRIGVTSVSSDPPLSTVSESLTTSLISIQELGY